MNKNESGMRCFISGKVQGVFFRAAAQEQAKRLDLTGWAANLPDGRVEVLAYGEKENLKDLYAWLVHGPEKAEVTNITYGIVPWKELKGFEIR